MPRRAPATTTGKRARPDESNHTNDHEGQVRLPVDDFPDAPYSDSIASQPDSTDQIPTMAPAPKSTGQLKSIQRQKGSHRQPHKTTLKSNPVARLDTYNFGLDDVSPKRRRLDTNKEFSPLRAQGKSKSITVEQAQADVSAQLTTGVPVAQRIPLAQTMTESQFDQMRYGSVVPDRYMLGPVGIARGADDNNDEEEEEQWQLVEEEQEEEGETTASRRHTAPATKPKSPMKQAQRSKDAPEPQKRGRGRPRKTIASTETTKKKNWDTPEESGAALTVQKKSPGRPRKQPPTAPQSSAEPLQATLQRNPIPDQQSGPVGQDNDSDSSDDSDDLPDLYGQTDALRAVFKVADDIHPIPARFDAVTTLIEHCTEMFTRLADLTQLKGHYTQYGDLATDVQELRAQALELCDMEGQVVRRQEIMRRQVDERVLPMMVGVLKAVVECYSILDQETSPSHSLELGHLSNVNALISIILDVAEKAQELPRSSKYAKTAQPVRRGILAPLRIVRDAFDRVIRSRTSHQFAAAARAKNERRRALDAAHAAQKADRAAETRRVREKWNNLHLERIYAEGGLMPLRKRNHLRVPDTTLDLDRNGVVFERVEAFIPRVGPLPAALQAARECIWTKEETAALVAGLEEYRGPLVFERLFRRYCAPGRMLNDYNVTEIVSKAALYKEWEAMQWAEGEVPGWVRGIPFWTGGQGGLRTENIFGGEADVGFAEDEDEEGLFVGEDEE